jgi:F-box and WD-40 domain protein CDC4
LKLHRFDHSRADRKDNHKIPSSKKDEEFRAERVSQRLSLINQRRLAKGIAEARMGSARSSSGKSRKPQKVAGSRPDDEVDFDTYREGRYQPHGLGMQMTEDTDFPATPELSELDTSNSRVRPYTTSFFESTYTPQSGLSQNDSFENIQSPSENPTSQSFANAVATPPIAESDLEPLAGSSSAIDQISATRTSINTGAALNASLPSPGLSPTYASDQGTFPSADEDEDIGAPSPATQYGESQETIENDDSSGINESQALQAYRALKGDHLPLSRSSDPSLFDTQAMLESFAAMPSEMKTLMMYQFLRLCPRKTLHFVANTVNPALKCDFLDQLPLELSLHILSFLDHRDLCRAAQVSKQWRNIIDSDETGWKELFDRDGFILPAGELDRAIKQGWGWQDPYGPDGCEEDLSPSKPEGEDLIPENKRLEPGPSRKGRSATSKRKRLPREVTSDRLKRRAVAHEFADKALGMLAKYPHGVKSHKTEGPLSAANAAAIAVPNPGRGFPGLQKLHLFKSLYRRHYMLQNSWMNGKVAPHHFAFPAHPAHVITCLQFDDDKILTGSDDTLIHVYDTKTGQLRKKLEGHEGGVWALQYEGNVLVSGSTDRSVRVWDIEKGLCTQVFHGHTSTVRCLQILMPELTGRYENGRPVMVPEKPLIITGSRDSQLRVWRLPEQGSKRYIQTGPPANDGDCPYFVRVLAGHQHSVRAIAAHQDTLVSGSYDNTVRVWKISTGETVHRLVGHAMKVYSVVLDHKRGRCISGSMDTFVKIWSLETGACLYTLEGHTSLVGLLDLRDERLVSAAADSTLRIWDPESGQCKSTLSAHTGAITCFQHDGQKVISGSDRTLKLWNIKTGECIKDLLTDLSGVWQVKFDERRCVAAVQRESLTYVEVGLYSPQSYHS